MSASKPLPGIRSVGCRLGLLAPSLLVPLPHAIDDHQTANAQALKQAGATILVPESRLSHEALSEQIETIMSNPDGAARMARAALGSAMPDATERLAHLAEWLARNATRKG